MPLFAKDFAVRVHVLMRLSVAACGVSLLAASPVLAAPPAITPGQVDTFTTGGTAGWVNGNVIANPTIQSGGPGGAGDNFMRFSADGNGPGGKLTVFNTAQWVGDYLTPGITAIEMDLRNLGSTELQIRLGFKQVAGFNAPGYSSTTPVVLPAGSGWVRATFPIDPSAYTAINDPASFTSVFGGDMFGELRILHATEPTLTGTNIAGALGVDNIRAVPSPAAAPLLLVAGLARRRRRGPSVDGRFIG